MRGQITLRLSRDELALLDEAARRLHLERAALIRSAALGAAELVVGAAPPLVLAVAPGALLRRVAERIEAQAREARAGERPARGRGRRR